ncbi:MAG TPA: hypothetical protein VK806_09640 [Bacteroidia bacterium]|jgi:hypothetical protein|nr:hypothetical protein [Bacteroidia bacterium]
MKSLLILILSLSFSIAGFGQAKIKDTVFIKHDSNWIDEKLNYVTDTVVFPSGMERNILIGTTVVPGTHNQYKARWESGIYFYKVTKSECQANASEEPGMGQDHINSIMHTDSTLIIDINIYDNCCYSFLCDISVDSTGTLNLIYNGYGAHCDCDCCFGLTYYCNIEKSPEPKEIKYSLIKAVIINGNKKSKKVIKPNSK